MNGELFFPSVIRWWLVIQIIGLAGLPLTTFLFRALPDRGYAFSKSLGLLLIGYGAWLLAMLGLVPFGVPLLIGVALAIGGGGHSCFSVWHHPHYVPHQEHTFVITGQLY